MKKFIKSIIKYFLITFFVITPICLRFIKGVGDDVDLAMKLATRHYNFKIKKIRLGDSVGKNLWETGYDSAKGEINLTCNSSISIIGHLLILKKLSLFNNIDTSVIIEGYFRPSSLLLCDLNQPWTRGYFLKKFYNDSWFFNTQLISAALRDTIDNRFLNQYPERILYRSFYFKSRCLLSSPLLFESGNYSNNNISKHLIEYVTKDIKDIHFFSNPIAAIVSIDEMETFNVLSKSIIISKPLIFNDSFFIADKTHLKLEYHNQGNLWVNNK